MLDWDTSPFVDKLNGYHGHTICKDLGYIDYRGFLEWCTCDAGRARQLAEPTLIEDMKRERLAFQDKFGERPESPNVPPEVVSPRK